MTNNIGIKCLIPIEPGQINKDTIYSSLLKVTGAHRRLEYVGSYNGAQVFDDYGHHPTEIVATAKALMKKKYNESIKFLTQLGYIAINSSSST